MVGCLSTGGGEDYGSPPAKRREKRSVGWSGESEIVPEGLV